MESEEGSLFVEALEEVATVFESIKESIKGQVSYPLTVTTAFVDVPFAIGMNQSAAEAQISNAGLTPSAINY